MRLGIGFIGRRRPGTVAGCSWWQKPVIAAPNSRRVFMAFSRWHSGAAYYPGGAREIEDESGRETTEIAGQIPPWRPEVDLMS